MTDAPKRRGTLFHTKEGDFDVTQILVALLIVVGAVAILGEVFGLHQASNAAWTWLGGVTAAVLLAAIPISKARILGSAALPGSLSTAISSAIRGMTKTEQTMKTETVTVDRKPEVPS